MPLFKSRKKTRTNQINGIKMFSRWDFILLSFVVIVVMLILLVNFLPKQGEEAQIYLDGKLYRTVSLSHDMTIQLNHGTIVVENGFIYIKDVDCEDKICEKTGKISKKGESIVCLPNKIVIKIIGKSDVEAII